MRFRKKDYIIFYVIFVIIFVINLRSPVKVGSFLPIVIGTIVPALVLGTITNLLFKRRIV